MHGQRPGRNPLARLACFKPDGQYMIASRLPMTGAETIAISLPGQQVVCLRCQVHAGAGTVTLYNVHFESPRESLNAFRVARKRPWYLPTAIQRLENNVEARLVEARAIQALVRSEKHPVVVAGDLNSTDFSLVCATLREAGLHDCFAESGRGYGYTYGHFLLQRRVPWLTFSWMRIDHIMVSSHLRSLRCWTGTGKASDHRPVIADVAYHKEEGIMDDYIKQTIFKAVASEPFAGTGIELKILPFLADQI